MTPDYWTSATQELALRDEVMGRLIQRFDDIALKSRGNAFSTLARSIVGQHVKAAESVWQKVIAAIPEITPHTIRTAEEALTWPHFRNNWKIH